MAESITFWLGAQVSLIRIDNFLKEQETKKFTQLSQSDASVIQFESATLAWPASKSPETSAEESIPLTELPFKLQSLQLDFKKDMLNVVCGPTSSGKTSLLLALLGEMDLIGGRVLFPREVAGVGSATWQISMDSFSETTAYCPQEPWIMNRSIRSNILMGLPFDGVRYQEVLHAVSLLRDLAALDDGDQTFAGDNGSKLSGGQNHRVALARALYSPSRYVLLDDCLSALDSTTATHVFFHAIIGPLMRGRTCIFATHNTQLAIPHSQQVVILCSGRVKAQGTGEQLVSAGFLDADIMKNKIEPPLPASRVETSVDSTNHVPGIPGASPSLKSLDRESLSVVSYAEAPKSKFDFTETKAEGAVSWSITHIYLSALGSKWYWILVLLGFAVQQLASLGTRLWIKEWASQYDMLNKGTSVSNLAIAEEMKPRKVNALYYWVIYTIIGLAYALITFSRDLIVFEGSLRASSKLFERLLNSILHAKLIFFDRVPLGQITNRFSRDTEVLDQWLSTFAISAFQIVVGLMTIIIFISVIIPEFLLVAAFICLAYFVVTAVYIGAARDFKRIEAVKRSPLYQQFEETIAGCVSIRAYGQSPVFTAQNHSLVDGINEPWLLVWASKEWLTLRIGILSSFIVFSTGAFVLWNVDSVSPGAAGLVLTYAATFTESILWLVQIYAIIQQNLVSVERIAEFTEIEQEEQEPLERPVQNLPYNWPSQGRIQFHEYSARYAPELALTLKSVSFAVEAGERCAIIGRTGAGKSTLALALIRGVEAEPGGGRIEIDGVDIASVSLKQLRQAVTVVPQDPKLFEGTLRENLAPLQCHNDDEMLDALRAVRLLRNADLITYNDLDRAAETLSRGQRQLLCIARGLLRRSRILVLDEATVSVDRATDVAIQVGLRATAAAGTTVLTIAHKLLTIADYDRIIVLDAGRVVEQGSIKELLGHRGDSSLFHRMCEESGDFNEIKKAAGLCTMSRL
jgi:ABC-type multidrug transport system fused ATPase/permease subunit